MQYTEGQLGRVFVVRIDNGEDMLASLRIFSFATTASGRVEYASSVPVPRSTQSSVSASYTGRQPSPLRRSMAGLGNSVSRRAPRSCASPWLS